MWSKIRYQVRRDDLIPTWARYYDERDDLVRTMTFTEHRVMDGRLVPAVMTVEPADDPGEVTRIRYHELEFDIGVDEDFFSLRNLRRQR